MTEDYPSTTARVRPGAGTVLGTFFYMWVLVGLLLGTALLLGPLRLITEGMDQAEWGRSSQDRTLIGLVLLYLVLSLVLTRWIVGLMFRTRNRNTRWTIAAVFTLLAALTSWEWSNPARLLAGVSGRRTEGSYAVVGGARFIFGAYPDESKLRELKRQGVTSVISLQHPGVLMEGEGISAEVDATRKLHLTFIQAPLALWGDDNDSSLEKLRTIEDTATGVFYVHTGLGTARLTLAKRVIEDEGQRIALGGGVEAATAFAERTTPLERGSLTRIDDQKWLIPYPNQREMFSLVLGGQAGTVVSLMDPLDPQQATWNLEMERLLKEHSIPFIMRPIDPRSPEASAVIAGEVHEMQPPVTLIAPATPGEDGRPRPSAQIALAFLRAYARIAPRSVAARASWRLSGAASNNGASIRAASTSSDGDVPEPTR
ncbi:MAG: hypothetical protein ACJ785_06990 [Gemmatimonadaceae bacterium]